MPNHHPRTANRRTFLRGGLVSLFALASGNILAACGEDTPKVPLGSFGGKIPVAKDQIPAPGGEPVLITEGRFWLVNLNGSEGDINRVGGKGGLIALYTKCPHAGCQVPWVPTLDGATVDVPGITGWFQCPCHQSTYSRAGIRVWGPASRSLSTMPIKVMKDGSIQVDTAKISAGVPENPKRAVPYTA